VCAYIFQNFSVGSLYVQTAKTDIAMVQSLAPTLPELAPVASFVAMADREYHRQLSKLSNSVTGLDH
jgi:hypothetical protein